MNLILLTLRAGAMQLHRCATVRAHEHTKLAGCCPPMASIAIMIGTPQGIRLLAFSDEREAADAAEMILRRLPAAALPAPVWIVCTDPGIQRRLTDYLADVQTELERSSFDRKLC